MAEEISDQELERQILQDIKDNEDFRDKTSEKFMDLSIRSIEQIRKWVFEVITICSAILGVFIVIGHNRSLVKNPANLFVALLLFVITIVYGVFHLKRAIEKDINELPKQDEKLRGINDEMIRAKKKVRTERSEESYDEYVKTQQECLDKLSKMKEPKVSLIYDYDFIFISFVTALCFLVISLIDFNWFGAVVYRMFNLLSKSTV